MKKNIEINECKRCSYKWIPARVKKPKRCPKCQAHEWWLVPLYEDNTVTDILGKNKNGHLIFGKTRRMKEA